jgi:glycosyltransferase involved in cell wall biosynthesis
VRLLTVGSLSPELGGSVRGGVATFHTSLLEGLAGYATEVEVVAVVPPGPLHRDISFPVFVRPGDVSIATFYEGLLTDIEPDVVLMNHVAHTIGVVHARLDSPPAVGIAHSWHNITFGNPEEVGRQREVTAEALSGLAALVVGSRHCLTEGLKLGLTYPVATEAIHYPLQPLYLESGLEVEAGERSGVLFLGSLIPRKNPEALVEAATLLPSLEIVLAGEGELEAPLREQITQRDVADRVRIVSHFPSAEHLHRVRELLMKARVMCLPSSSESFGLAFIEALACGTPVVGFGPTVREIRNAMGIEIGEPLDEGSPEEIAAAIERVLASGWDRAELRSAAVETFGLRRVTERYMDLFSRVAGEYAAEGV